MEREELTLARLVGRRLRRMRLARGRSQAALARAVGRSRTTVCRWEAGERLPSLPMLVRVARALDCPVAVLVAGVERVEGE